MKKLLFILAMLIVVPAMAQKELTVTVAEKHSSKGKVSGFEVEIPQATTKDAISLLEKTLVSKGLFKKTPKLVKENDEWIMRGVVVDRIAADSLNVYAQAASFSDRALVTLFFETPKGFVGNADDEGNIIEAAKDYVRDYAVTVYRDAVEKELKSEESKLKSLQNDLSKAEKQESNNDKQISSLKSEINSAKAKVTETEGLILQNKSAIKLDEANTVTAELEAKNKELQKEADKQSKQIKQSENKIKQLEKKISEGQSEQKSIKAQIDRQQATVDGVKTKLANIK